MMITQPVYASKQALIKLWKLQQPTLIVELSWLDSTKIKQFHVYNPRTPIVCMWGLGQDSFNGVLRLIAQLKAQGYPLHNLCC